MWIHLEDVQMSVVFVSYAKHSKFMYGMIHTVLLFFTYLKIFTLLSKYKDKYIICVL